MQSFFKIRLLICLLFAGDLCFAAIGNNTITGTSSVCYGAKSSRLVGSSPSGGTTPFNFLWLASTQGETDGYVPADGSNIGQNYTPPLFTVDTWFKRVAYSGGNTDTSAAFKITVVPYPNPVAGYIVNKAVQCFSGHFYHFADTSSVSSGSIVSRRWEMGDGTIDSVTDPDKVYSIAFNYNVKLVVTTDLGCKDSMIRTMSVLNQPTALISHKGLFQCFDGNVLILRDSSFIPIGSLFSYWDFGDGTFSTERRPFKVYNDTGTYTLKLVSITDYDCKDSTTATVTIGSSPVAGFTVNNAIQCLSKNQFAFHDASSAHTGSLRHKWYFGNSDSSEIAHPVHSYDTAGSYHVMLVATNESGCTDTLVKTMTVHSEITAGFMINDTEQCLDGNHFELNDTSVSDTGSIERIWHFGNGDTTSVSDPEISYNTAGSFPVSLVLLNNSGCSDSVVQMITVHPKPPALHISGETIVFQSSTQSYTFPATPSSVYNWNADNGTIQSGNGTPAVDVLWGTTSGNAGLKAVEISGFGCIGDTSFLPVVITRIPDSLALGSDTLFVSAQASSDSVLITSNTDWSISNSVSWITINPMNGNRDSILRLSFTANTGPLRIATIIITAGSVSQKLVIVQETTVGIAEINNPFSVNIYPNPSSGFVTVMNKYRERISVEVYNITGKLMNEQRNISSSVQQMDYSFLPEGIYIMRISAEGKSRNFRLIITW